MRFQMLLMAAAAASTGGAAQAAGVDIRDAVARVTVVPEARGDVRVEIVRANPELPLTVRVEGDRTIVDGGLRNQIRTCRTGEKGHIKVSGVGNISWDERPQVVIHTPRDVSLWSNGAVSGEIGRSASLEITNSGCGNWTIADVAGDATVRESGAGAVRMGQAGHLKAHLSGAGNLHATRVRQGIDADLSGAGGVKVDEISGPIEANVSGVGKVQVAGGRASTVRARVSGVGGVEFDGVAESLDAAISGFGGIRVRSVTGQVRRSVSGLGHITVADRS